MTPELKVGMRVMRKLDAPEALDMKPGDVGIITEVMKHCLEIKTANSSGVYDSQFYEPVIQESPTFELGDRVKAFGVEGVVAGVLERCTTEDPYPVVVEFPLFGNKRNLFTPEGKYETWHAEPSLTLVEKWKPMKEELTYAAVFEGESILIPKTLLCKRFKVTFEEIR